MPSNTIIGEDATCSVCPSTLFYYYTNKLLPGVSGKVVDGNLAIFPSQQILQNLIGGVEVQSIRMIEVVILCIVVILLRQTLVKGVQCYIGAVQPDALYYPSTETGFSTGGAAGDSNK